MKPFIKYAGNKQRFADAIAARMPNKRSGYRNFHETFLGAGAIALTMLLHSVERKAYLSDITPELINMWQCVQRHPLKLCRAIAALKTPKNQTEFEAVRDSFNDAKCLDLHSGAKWIANLGEGDKYAIAAQYIWLNKNSFNGLYRVNNNGEYNVSWNKDYEDGKRPKYPSVQELCDVSMLLKNAEITCQPFHVAMKDVREGDLVYCDPPYVPISETASFVGYTKEGFGDKEQRHLHNVLVNMTKRGAYVFASNSDCAYVRSLYKDWSLHQLYRSNNISCIGENRGKVAELLIYKTMEAAIAS